MKKYHIIIKESIYNIQMADNPSSWRKKIIQQSIGI
jgi:hypothetical protein